MTAGDAARKAVASSDDHIDDMAGRLGGVWRGLRGRHLMAIDLLAILLASYLALSFRFDGLLSYSMFMSFVPLALLPLLVRPIVNTRFGLYNRVWGYASVPDLGQIVWAVVVGTVICLVIYFWLGPVLGRAEALGFPRSFWALEMVLSLAMIGGTRFMIRAATDLGTKRMVGGTILSLTPALLFGAGRAGALMARSARREPKAGVNPVGFLDEDPRRRGATVAGLHVFGDLDRLDDAVRRTSAKMLLITMPSASGESVRRVMERAVEAGLTVRIVPPVHELLDGGRAVTKVREVRLADLLSRHQSSVHAPGVGDAIKDKVIMITGAGGSIGSELARQVYGLRPSRLVLVDRAESPLYMIQRELELRGLDGAGQGELSIHLANVASRGVIRRIIDETRPDIIFHAAACKHVPMMEEHPSEGVQVNIGGTQTVLSAAIDADVPKFVLVSTDKAVEPSSVMGATKRVAEWLVADAAIRTGKPYVAVRFGNVLGSAGSVVPIIQSQLENGEAVTVTHPDMSRYFMTIEEAGWLILDAAAIGRAGDLFVLDMGEPVRIIDMVHDLIRLSGRDVEGTPIRFTGLRPGEKLHERLFYETERVQRTEVDKIFKVADSPPPIDVRQSARTLVKFATGDQDALLRTLLFETVWPVPSGDAGPALDPAGEVGPGDRGDGLIGPMIPQALTAFRTLATRSDVASPPLA